jgi:hypothetical protein
LLFRALYKLASHIELLSFSDDAGGKVGAEARALFVAELQARWPKSIGIGMAACSLDVRDKLGFLPTEQERKNTWGLLKDQAVSVAVDLARAASAAEEKQQLPAESAPVSSDDAQRERARDPNEIDFFAPSEPSAEEKKHQEQGAQVVPEPSLVTENVTYRELEAKVDGVSSVGCCFFIFRDRGRGDRSLSPC